MAVSAGIMHRLSITCGGLRLPLALFSLGLSFALFSLGCGTESVDQSVEGQVHGLLDKLSATENDEEGARLQAELLQLGPRIVPFLIERVESRGFEYDVDALEVLVCVGTRARAYLLRKLDHGEVGEQRAIVSGFARVRVLDEELGEAIAYKIESDRRPGVRRLAAAALANEHIRITDYMISRLILGLGGDEDQQVVATCEETLLIIGARAKRLLEAARECASGTIAAERYAAVIAKMADG